MIVDAFTEFSTAQDISTTVGTVVSTNILDMRAPGSQDTDLGQGTPLFVHFALPVAVASATAATINFQVFMNNTADGDTPVVIAQTLPLAEAAMLINTRFVLPIRPDIEGTYGQVLRYLGCQYVIAGATTTTGTVTAHLVLSYQSGAPAYASGFTF